MYVLLMTMLLTLLVLLLLHDVVTVVTTMIRTERRWIFIRMCVAFDSVVDADDDANIDDVDESGRGGLLVFLSTNATQ